MARREHRLLPRSKVKSWIRNGCNPMLAFGVGRRDEAGVMVEVWCNRNAKLGFRGSTCDEAGVEVNWESGKMHEVRCTKCTSTNNQSFQSNANLSWYSPEDLECNRNTWTFPYLTNKPIISAITSGMDRIRQPPEQKIGACHVWCSWFPEFGRDTEPCETQIVVLSIVHETQTQNYIIIM